MDNLECKECQTILRPAIPNRNITKTKYVYCDQCFQVWETMYITPPYLYDFDGDAL